MGLAFVINTLVLFQRLRNYLQIAIFSMRTDVFLPFSYINGIMG